MKNTWGAKVKSVTVGLVAGAAILTAAGLVGDAFTGSGAGSSIATTVRAGAEDSTPWPAPPTPVAPTATPQDSGPWPTPPAAVQAAFTPQDSTPWPVPPTPVAPTATPQDSGPWPIVAV